MQRQAGAGITVLNDGEQGKPGYSTYMKDRLTGFEGESTAVAVSGEAKDFPEYTARRAGRAVPNRPACTGPIAWKDRDAVRRDIENLQAAVKEVEAEEVFMTAASPGVVAHFMKDQYYGSEEKYLYALADALNEEYDAIHRAGFVLQVRLPDLCMSRHNRFSDLSTKEFKESPSFTWRPLITPCGTFRLIGCACTCAGATTKARTTWTSRSRKSST